MTKTILIVGTFDTKDDELRFIQRIIEGEGGQTLTMDVSVLGDPSAPAALSKHDVAQAAGTDIGTIIALGDENEAMQAMARGAMALARDLLRRGRIDGAILLGGTMGTDLALDVCSVLPLGFPKYIVSTVAFSPLLPPDRIPADVQMILWAGGLYGLNSICRASLSQAAGAVLGAANAVRAPSRERPLVGMTSFGKTVLRYMVRLKPELEARGFEVAVFHPTGMGGRAFEDLAAQGAFACVLDLATQEVGNHVFGSSLSAGESRLTAAGLNGTPQIVAPGCHDLVDIVGWQERVPHLQSHESHAHNRLLSSVVLTTQDRRKVAQAHVERLATAKGPSVFVMPLHGCHEWDREGGDLHDAEGLAAFAGEMRTNVPDNVDYREVDAHINDAAFSDAVLAILDGWIADGVVQTGQASRALR